MMTASKRFAQICLLAAMACAPAATAAAHGGTPHGASTTAISKFDLDAIRKATVRFQDVNVAEKEGYSQFLGCVSGPCQECVDAAARPVNLVGTTLVPRHIRPNSNRSRWLIFAHSN